MNEQLRLLEPMRIGDLQLANRVFMAPLTRCRASAGRVPNTLMHVTTKVSILLVFLVVPAVVDAVLEPFDVSPAHALDFTT